MSSRSSSSTSSPQTMQTRRGVAGLTMLDQELLSLIAELNVQDTKTDSEIRTEVQRHGLVERMRHIMQEDEEPSYHSPLFRGPERPVPEHGPQIPLRSMSSSGSSGRSRKDTTRPLEIQGKVSQSRRGTGGESSSSANLNAPKHTSSAAPKVIPTPISDKFKTKGLGKLKPLPPLPTWEESSLDDDRTPRPGDQPSWNDKSLSRSSSASSSYSSNSSSLSRPPPLPPKPVKHSQILLNLASKGGYVSDRARRVLSVVAEGIDSAPRPTHSRSRSDASYSSSSSSSGHTMISRGHGRSSSSASSASSSSHSSAHSRNAPSVASSSITLVERPETNTTLKAAKATRDAAIVRARTLVASRSNVAVPRPDRQERQVFQSNRNRVRIVETD